MWGVCAVVTFSCGFGCSLMYGYKHSLIDCMVVYGEYLPSVVCSWHTVAVIFHVDNHHHHLDAATL
jgi:hypothetical protein